MRIRKFQAESVRQALLKVKEELGPEAVILRTEKVRGAVLGQDLFEVTAGLEDRFAPPAASSSRASPPAYGPGSRPNQRPAVPVPQPSIAGSPIPAGGTSIGREEWVALQQGIDEVRRATEKPAGELAAVRRRMDRMQSVLEALAGEWRLHAGTVVPEALEGPYRRLLAADFQEELARRACDEAAALLPPDADEVRARAALVPVLAAMLPCAPVRPLRGDRHVVLLTGPTGVGKTTTLMKLAVRMVQQGRQVGILGCDNHRIGAAEQIRIFADVAALPLRLVYTDVDLAQGLDALARCEVLLVDTAGRSPRHAGHMSELAVLVERLQPREILLAQSATTRLEDMTASVANHRDLGPSRLVITKIDETDRHGAACTLIARTRIPVALLCFGQEVPEHMSEASSEELARLLLGDDDVPPA